MAILDLINEAIKLIDDVDAIVGSDAEWKTKYDMVFSESVSRELRKVLSQINIKLDYYDPDTDYKDDVLAYQSALEELKPQLLSVKANLDEAQILRQSEFETPDRSFR